MELAPVGHVREVARSRVSAHRQVRGVPGTARHDRRGQGAGGPHLLHAGQPEEGLPRHGVRGGARPRHSEGAGLHPHALAPQPRAASGDRGRQGAPLASRHALPQGGDGTSGGGVHHGADAIIPHPPADRYPAIAVHRPHMPVRHTHRAAALLHRGLPVPVVGVRRIGVRHHVVRRASDAPPAGSIIMQSPPRGL